MMSVIRTERTPVEPVADDFPKLMKEGEHDAICKKAEYGLGPGGEKKLYLTFVIYGGEYDGLKLFMACRKPQGKLKQSHKLHQQWSIALGRCPTKGDRFCKDIFVGKMYRVLVETTKGRFRHGKLRPEFLQYSVVREILEPLTGIDQNEGNNK